MLVIGYLPDDFDRELQEFIIDPKLIRTNVKAERQRKEFCCRFPLRNFKGMGSEEYCNPEGGKNDFCYWITDGTSEVTNRLAWAKAKLGISTVRGYYGHQRDLRRDVEWRRIFHESVSRLAYFLEHYGTRTDIRLEHEFGQPLLLKMLYLYYPNDFINIASVGWIDRIVYGAALDYGDTIFIRSHAVGEFYQKVFQHTRPLEPVSFRIFLNEYFGLSNSCKEYVEFLTKEEGLSSRTAEHFSRSLRQLSRLLVGFGLTRKSLFKWTIDELREGSGRIVGSLEERVKCPSQKLDDFAKAFDLYSSFVLRQGKPLLRQSFSIVGARPFRESLRRAEVTKKTDGQKTTDDWLRELQMAKSPEAVANILQVSGSVRPYYRHYTTLSAFLCVSDDWMFRLTRGDDPEMNDQLEWRRLGDTQLWKRTYISSFSCVEGESAAMWGLYGKPSNEALRLSFDHKTMSSWMEMLHDRQGKPRLQFFGVDGMPGLTAELNWQDIEIFFGDVLYGGKVGDGADQEAGYIFRRSRLRDSVFARFNPKIDKAREMTGFIKSVDWAYEEESRIIVRLNEKTVLPERKTLADVQYVYVPIQQEMLKQVEFMIGPCIPEKLRPIVEDKIKSILSTSAIVSKSKYTGNLKFK